MAIPITLYRSLWTFAALFGALGYHNISNVQWYTIIYSCDIVVNEERAHIRIPNAQRQR